MATRNWTTDRLSDQIEMDFFAHYLKYFQNKVSFEKIAEIINRNIKDEEKENILRDLEYIEHPKVDTTSLTKCYKWSASSNDGAFEDYSYRPFDTKKECYEDMRASALEKMKWNTQFDSDFSDLEDDEFIGYEVEFKQDKIIHKSYSGIYTYKMEEMWLDRNGEEVDVNYYRAFY